MERLYNSHVYEYFLRKDLLDLLEVYEKNITNLKTYDKTFPSCRDREVSAEQALRLLENTEKVAELVAQWYDEFNTSNTELIEFYKNQEVNA